jgi:hypothetical protein
MLSSNNFANQTNVGEAEIDAYLQNTSTTRDTFRRLLDMERS